MDDAALREDMVDSLAHESKGVLRSDRVALAMREVPRDPFVADGDRAYVDQASRHRGARVLAPRACPSTHRSTASSSRPRGRVRQRPSASNWRPAVVS